MKGLKLVVRMLICEMAILLVAVAVAWAAPAAWQQTVPNGTVYGGAVGKSVPSADKTSVEKVRLPNEKINVNTAGEAELMRLPGVGPKIAKEIIARRSIALFKSPKDLLEVKGIGKKVLSEMIDYIAF